MEHRLETAGMVTTRVVDVEGARIYYKEAGHGFPIFLIAGGTADADCWMDTFGRLAAHNRVIAYDRRGHSRSSGPPSSDWSRHADDARALLHVLNAVPVTVVGWSGGGLIALDLAIKTPELVRNLALIEPPFHAMKDFDPGFLLTFARVMLLRRLKGDQAAAEAFKRFVDGPSWERLPESSREAMLSNARALMADLDAGSGEYMSDHDVRGVNCPVLLLYGSDSPPILRRPIKRLAQLLPKAEVRQVEGSGHLMHFDRPDEFVEAVLSMAR